jgi:hypothetical protein
MSFYASNFYGSNFYASGFYGAQEDQLAPTNDCGQIVLKTPEVVVLSECDNLVNVITDGMVIIPEPCNLVNVQTNNVVVIEYGNMIIVEC